MDASEVDIEEVLIKFEPYCEEVECLQKVLKKEISQCIPIKIEKVLGMELVEIQNAAKSLNDSDGSIECVNKCIKGEMYETEVEFSSESTQKLKLVMSRRRRRRSDIGRRTREAKRARLARARRYQIQVRQRNQQAENQLHKHITPNKPASNRSE